MMARWGRWVHRHHWWVLAFSVLFFGASLGLTLHGGQLKNNTSIKAESVTAGNVMDAQLPHASSGTYFQLVLGTKSMTTDDPAFRSAVDLALAPLQSDSHVTGVLTPWNAPAGTAAETNAPQISNDRHYVLVTVVMAKTDFSGARQVYKSLRDPIRSQTLEIHAFGLVPLAAGVDSATENDIRTGEIISLPLAALVLVLVFGSGAAALVCLGVGIVGVLGGVAAMFVLSDFMDVSTYAQNIVTLIGLGVAIDYSLFIVSRFREEQHRGRTTERALMAAMATAGRAITFSGLTVAVGLCGLLFYSGSFLVSLGICGAMVVASSVLAALTFLPAVLSILGPRVDRLRLPLLQRRHDGPRRHLWHELANRVMRHPWRVLLPCLAFLILLGSPFPQLKLANSSDASILPPSADAHVGTDLVNQEFPTAGGTTIQVVVDWGSGSPLDAGAIAADFALTRKLTSLPGVTEVQGYVTPGLAPGVTDAAGFQKLYAGGTSALPQQLRDGITRTLGPNIAVITVHTDAAASSDAATSLVRQIRAGDSVSGATTYVTGLPAFNVDWVDYMLGHTPTAVAFVMGATFFILLFLLRSLALPLKAVVMNLFSLSAALGSMVFIFQQGHFSNLLGISYGPLDPTLPILLFCVVFGLSMDYEVFLLTRMQEAWIREQDNRLAVAEGLEASGRLVTGAALIMVCVFGAFSMASVLVIKAIGIGMLVAVLVDATVVRALVVPALMRLLGPVNWWAPRFMRRTRGLEEYASADEDAA